MSENARKLTLKDLTVGEKFYPASAGRSGRATPIWKVMGPCKFNIGHGSSTRECLNLINNNIESKSCRLEVVRYETRTNNATLTNEN